MREDGVCKECPLRGVGSGELKCESLCGNGASWCISDHVIFPITNKSVEMFAPLELQNF